MWNVMSSTARTQPTRRCTSTPCVIGKYILSPRTPSSSGWSLLLSVAAEPAARASCSRAIRLLRSHVHPAGDAVIRANWLQLRVLFLGLVHGKRAARGERAAAREVHQVGRHALDRDQVLPSRLVDARYRAQQAERVGVPGVLEQLLR